MKIKKLSVQEKNFIDNNYLTIPIKTMARQMGRSADTIVRNYMIRNNLIVPKKIIEQRKRDSCFSKGHVPANKGLEQSQYMTPEQIEKTIGTRFKKGQIVHNHKPLGYERITVDGYTEVKTAEPKTFSLKHRMIYESHHGVVLTKKDLIRFKDGNKQNFSPENLIKTDNKGHLRQNRMCDTSIAKMMSGKDPILAKALLKSPKLLDLQRTQYSLNKAMKKDEQK